MACYKTFAHRRVHPKWNKNFIDLLFENEIFIEFKEFQ